MVRVTTHRRCCWRPGPHIRVVGTQRSALPRFSTRRPGPEPEHGRRAAWCETSHWQPGGARKPVRPDAPRAPVAGQHRPRQRLGHPGHLAATSGTACGSRSYQRLAETVRFVELQPEKAGLPATHAAPRPRATSRARGRAAAHRYITGKRTTDRRSRGAGVPPFRSSTALTPGGRPKWSVAPPGQRDLRLHHFESDRHVHDNTVESRRQASHAWNNWARSHAHPASELPRDTPQRSLIHNSASGRAALAPVSCSAGATGSM